jgi:hypothetical protein
MSSENTSKLVPESKTVAPERVVALNSNGAIGMLTVVPLMLMPVMLAI